MSDASAGRACRGGEVLTDRPDHQARASTAGPDEPDPYKSDGRAPGSMDETAFLAEVQPERPASVAFASAPPCPAAAEQSVEPRAVLLDSVLQAAAKDCLRPSVNPADLHAPPDARDASDAAELPASADAGSLAELEYWEPDCPVLQPPVTQPTELQPMARVEVFPESSSPEELSEDRSHPTAEVVVVP